MDFELSRGEQAFREEVRTFIKNNLPPAKQRGADFLTNWLKKVRDKRWVGFSWPKDAGGGDGSLIEQAILREEMALAKAPPLGTSFMGLAWVGPGIIQYGTPAQKQRFIPAILDSKVSWCTGYSEPNHGSGLASIQAKAVLNGDHYVVNGQKIWTTSAPWADWIILLVRTDFAPKVKHDGITCLLVDMKTPGIDVRPIENMASDKHFAEVFFTDVKVPVANRLGDEGKGWAVTVSALANERSSIGEITQMFDKLDTLKDLVKRTRRNGKPAAEDPATRRTLAQFEAKSLQ
jgi:alkylation response protein AidB-like acyl-CoA dehydrogenase